MPSEILGSMYIISKRFSAPMDVGAVGLGVVAGHNGGKCTALLCILLRVSKRLGIRLKTRRD